MKFIDLEFGDNTITVKDEAGEIILRIASAGPNHNQGYAIALSGGSNCVPERVQEHYIGGSWAQVLGFHLKAKGYGYVPIRNFSITQHAVYTYHQAAKTEVNP